MKVSGKRPASRAKNPTIFVSFSLFSLDASRPTLCAGDWTDLQPISAHTNSVCSGLPVCGLTLQCVDLEIGKLKSAGFSLG